MKRKQYLFCPGPVHVAENIKKAAIENEICHREKDFEIMLNDLNQNILSLFQIKNTSKYYPVVLTGSSTSANESVLSTAADNKRVLVITNGEFGNRLYNISIIHNPKTYKLDFGWGNYINTEKVEEQVKKLKIDFITIVHHETSTGMLNPVIKIGKIAKKYNTLFFVDSVSSIGADHLDVEKANIDFCTSTSGKAIGSFPGMGFIVGKISEFEKLKTAKQKTMYLHLYNFYHYSKDLLQTPNTPNVSGFFALNQAIKNILKEGVDNRIESVQKKAQYLRTVLTDLGLTFLIREKSMSNVLTTVLPPDYMTVDEIQEKLRANNIIVYGGKGPLKDKVFQVANIGDLDWKDIKYFEKTLKKIFQSSILNKSVKEKSFSLNQVEYVPTFKNN